MSSEFDLRSLDADPPTPSRVDVERAIAEGRRRRNRRSAGYAGAAVLTVAAVVGGSVAAGSLFTEDTRATDTPAADTPTPDAAPAPPTPPTSCTLERLPVPDGEPMALTSGADPTGRYIVGRTYPEGGGYRSVIWEDGRATAVDLPGDSEEILDDVNSSGTAVGWSYPDIPVTEDNEAIPYVYRDGQVTPLPGVASGSAYAINEAGAIAGVSQGDPVVWPSATETPVRLPVPDGVGEVFVTGLDEDGTVVGNLDQDRPYVWFPDGSHRELEVPPVGGETVTGGRVFSVSGGWATGLAVVGDASTPGAESGTRPVRWNLRTGEATLVEGLDSSPPGDVNAHGWMVAVSTEGRAVLVTDSGMVELPELSPHEPGSLTNLPDTLTDDGRLVAGQSDDQTDTIQAVVWRCE